MFVHGPGLENDDVGVDVERGLPDVANQFGDGAVGAHDELQRGSPLLVGVQVEIGAGRLSERTHFGIACDTDDANGGFARVAQPEALADRILAGPEAACGSLADDGDACIGCLVGRREIAACDERYAHGDEVVGIDVSEIDVMGIDTGRRFDAIDEDLPRLDGGAERQPVGSTDDGDTGQRAQGVTDALLHERPAVLVEAAQFEHGPEDGRRPGVESGIDLLSLAEAAQEQAGAHEQEQRNGDLAGDEDAAQRDASAPGPCSTGRGGAESTV